MSSYGVFATVYDRLTENVEYEKRASYINGILKSNGIENAKLVDLACGTGSIAYQMLKLGHSVTGVDLSNDMLTVAQSKLCDFGDRVSLISADMTAFKPSFMADGVMCLLDSINHLNSREEVIKTFSSVYSYLKDGGVFIFDVNTVYKHREILGDNTFVFDNDDSYLVWDNELLDDRTVRILLDIFIFNGKAYDRYCEEFNEIAYYADEIKDMLSAAGFKNITAYDDLTLDPLRKNSERMYFVCKK